MRAVYFVTIDGWEWAVTTSDNPPCPPEYAEERP